jgi:NAD(P)-dependent dehydrogenase (short-subunit alcohol dehydrogenase family)
MKNPARSETLSLTNGRMPSQRCVSYTSIALAVAISVLHMNTAGKALMFAGLAGVGLVVGRSLGRRAGASNLRDKVVLITGGSRGLGLVLAREMAAVGCRVAICARDEGELARAEADLRGRGADVQAFRCDVTDEVQVEKLVGDVVHHFGRVDILVNDAGVIRMAPLELQTKKDFEDTMDIHFWAPYYTTRAVMPSMIRQRWGRIVNIASIGGKVPVPHLSSYCASKFALVGLSASMGVELRKYDIYVTTVCPGLMRTGSHINAEFKGQHKKEYAFFSIMGSSHLTTLSAEHAAREIIAATARGDAELVISPQAKLAAKFNALFPNITANMLALSNRLLPEAKGSPANVYTGLESRSPASPKFMTSNTDEASLRNNELKPGESLD